MLMRLLIAAGVYNIVLGLSLKSLLERIDSLAELTFDWCTFSLYMFWKIIYAFLPLPEQETLIICLKLFAVAPDGFNLIFHSVLEVFHPPSPV